MSYPLYIYFENENVPKFREEISQSSEKSETTSLVLNQGYPHDEAAVRLAWKHKQTFILVIIKPTPPD